MIVLKKLTMWGQATSAKTPILSVIAKPYGVGEQTSKYFLSRFGLPISCRIGSFSNPVREVFSKWLKLNALVLRSLYKIKASRLADLSRFGSKKSLRRSMGLPVNGQRTRSNAQTVRSLLRYKKKSRLV